MDFIAGELATRRNRVTAVFSAGGLVLVIALLAYRGSRHASGLPPEWERCVSR